MEKKISVKDLLMQAFLTGWERSDKSISQDDLNVHVHRIGSQCP